MIQASHLLSSTFPPLSFSNHLQKHFQLLLFNSQKLISLPIFCSIALRLRVPLSIAPIPVLTLKTHSTYSTILWLISALLLRACLTTLQPVQVSPPTLTSMIHCLTNLHHLSCHLKLALLSLQILNSHLLLPRQQRKPTCLISFQKYHLMSPMQGGRRGSERMKTRMRRSVQNKNKGKRLKTCAN
jgi:hypothetical protein